MKVVCIGDAYITEKMMVDGVTPFLKEGDSVEVFFFGLPDKTEMRDIAKMIETGRREEVAVPAGLHEAVEDAFRYDRLVLASLTYNGDVFPFMKTFINDLLERNYQNRKVAFIENGTWAPNACKVMKSMFEKSKNITFAETQVTVKSAVNEDAEAAIDKLADELLK